MCSSLFRCIALNLFFSLVQSSDFIARKFQIWNEQKKELVPVELIFTEGDQTLFIWKDYEAIGAPERGRPESLERTTPGLDRRFKGMQFSCKIHLEPNENTSNLPERIQIYAQVEDKDKQTHPYSVIGKNLLQAIDQQVESFALSRVQLSNFWKFALSSCENTTVTTSLYPYLDSPPLDDEGTFECHIRVPKAPLKTIKFRAHVNKSVMAGESYMGWKMLKAIRDSGNTAIYRGYYVKHDSTCSLASDSLGMNFVAYSVILVIHSLSQYTVTAPVPEKQNVFHVQGIIGCSASENGPTSAIPATVEFYAKPIKVGKLEYELLGTLRSINIKSEVMPFVIQGSGTEIKSVNYDQGEREEGQPTKRPPAGSFAIQGSWPEVCSNCEKGVYLKLMYHCPSGDHKERSLVHKDVPIHPVIKIEIPTKFITVRESDDVSTPPKIFDFGKISM
ncbi:hypothetical protein DdX_15457 [Ditylenchus destructor]|uniref:Uncharacterized protein n=1 Tax=Ditylenchus destructor TaxID=166010 RepID=A0AAD4R0V9_9BILA|nr:hypothetical protein DdX_15457 [Ditylenchus destructor]